MQRRLVFAVVFGIVGAGFSRPEITASLSAQAAQPPQVKIETVYPRYVARGQTTVINVAIPSKDAVKAVEISPATGVTVSALKGSGSETEQAIGWWEITLDVAKDAAPGDRSLVLVMGAGRTAPATITVPTHVPTISNLTIVAPQSNQPTIDLRVAAVDATGDLGEAPYVWFMAGCGGDPLVGAVRGTVSAGVVHAIIPNLRKAAGAPAAGRCDLQVRVTDATGIDSNTLKTTVEFRN